MTAHVLNRSSAERTLARQFAEQERREPSPPRAAAFARFAEAGLPTRRVEAWHYTDLRASMADAAPILPAPTREDVEAARGRLAGRERFASGAQVVLLGGRFIAQLSDRLPAGVLVVEGLVPTAVVDDPLADLNEAMSPPGCTISVSREAKLVEPIIIVHLANNASSYSVYSRTAIVVDAGRQASFVEIFEGAHAGVQRHAATAITLAEGARASHIAVVGDEAGLHIETQIFELAETAELTAFGLVSGGEFSRRQIFVRMRGKDAKVSLGGLALIDNSRRADTTLQVVHSAPAGTSREFYRAIVDDDAVGVFQGKIIVEKRAQKTDGAMKSQAILLSPRAQMNGKPELEIYADDVVCGHGATVASLDPEHLFYLQSRGIPNSDAKRMLLEAFGGESIDRVEDKLLVDALRARLSAWLGTRMRAGESACCRISRDGEGEDVNKLVEPTLGAYDVEAIRADFPILAERPYGKPLVYLDSAASAQKPRQVIDRVSHAYEHEYANVHRGLHYLANAATEAYEAARETVRRFINAASHEEIVFTRSATEAINLVSSSFGRAHISAGDEIVLSVMEHHSNIVPWHFHRERKGAVLRWIDVADDGSFSLETFERALSDRTKIVAITQMSNVLGTATPIKEIVKIAHGRGIPVLVDGSQGAVHLDVDVRDLGADFYVFTGHKVYGPTGIGVLYGKRERLEKMPPYQGGGEMIEEVTKETVSYNQPPHRFEAGTPPIVQAIGLGAALDYIEGIGRARIRAHEEALRDYAHELLSSINSLRIIGVAEGKGPIVSFTMDGAHAHDIATLIDRSGVAVRAGTHCAMPLLQRFGVTSTCRASFGLYNTFEEVETLADSLSRARKLFQ